MAVSVNHPSDTATPDPKKLRLAQLLRAGVLVVAGFVIAFSAPMHENLEFDRWVLVISLAALGLVTLVEYAVVRQTRTAWLIALRAAIALVTAVLVVVYGTDALSLGIVIGNWAALTALLTIARLVLGGAPRRSAAPSALLSGLLAIVLLLVGDDVVAIIGFFGAYALIRGVFLGISAFDTKAGNDAPAASGDEAGNAKSVTDVTDADAATGATADTVAGSPTLNTESAS